MITPALVKITAPTASEICKNFTPQPAAQALLQPTHTPTQYLGVLEQNNLSQDSIHLLAHGMPERESVWWACQSSQKVAGQLEPADKEALEAAQTWVKNPNEATQAQAAAAAAKTDFQGPGAWAAQGAAFSQTGRSAANAVSAAPAGLTGHAVAGSVMLAAAMPAKPAVPAVAAPVLAKPALNSPTIERPAIQTPKLAAPQLGAPQIATPELAPPELAKTAEIHKPFIDLGKEIAAGKNTWA